MKFNTKKNTVKKSLSNNELTLGSWITLGHPAIAEIMSGCGYDWLAVDLEHSVITIKEAEELIRIINLSDVTPLVRLTSNDENQIKRVMDAGSHGVIVPMVKSAQDAQNAINAVKYPPKGIRGVGLARAQGYGKSFESYMKWLEEESIVIVQIEHIDAVNNLEEIFSVKDVDGYIVGPYDLSASMSIPGNFSHPDFLAAMEKIKSVAQNLNISGGIHIIEPDVNQLEERIKEGYSFIAYSLDIRMLENNAKSGIEFLQESDQ